MSNQTKRNDFQLTIYFPWFRLRRVPKQQQNPQRSHLGYNLTTFRFMLENSSLFDFYLAQNMTPDSKYLLLIISRPSRPGGIHRTSVNLCNLVTRYHQ